MSYAKNLLDRATATAGSRYALAKLTGLNESDLSKAANGKRGVPAAWVLPLARVAGVDPTEAMEFWDMDRAEKKRLRRQLSSSVPGGGAATSPTSSASGERVRRPKGSGESDPQADSSAFDRVHIVSTRRCARSKAVRLSLERGGRRRLTHQPHPRSLFRVRAGAVNRRRQREASFLD